MKGSPARWYFNHGCTGLDENKDIQMGAWQKRYAAIAPSTPTLGGKQIGRQGGVQVADYETALRRSNKCSKKPKGKNQVKSSSLPFEQSVAKRAGCSVEQSR